MVDAPIDCDFPVWGLMPKKETGVVSFINKHAEYDGRGTIIAILDSGVDPAATGLEVTSTGEKKVIERYDCSGCGDVDTSTIIKKVTDGCITGLTGRKLKIPDSWKNPSGVWRVGVLYPFSLYPVKLKERMQEHRKTHDWDVNYKPAFAEANKNLQDFETDVVAKNPVLSPEDKILKEELEARVEVLQAAEKKYNDVGPTYDCVLFHDGSVWRACIDTTESGDLASGVLLGEYSRTHEHTHLTPFDEMTVSINVHDDGNTLEVVGMCSTHGTHVAAIAAGYYPDAPELNGVAPGAKIVSLTIGDSRLGSMETGTALVRACIKIMELSKTMKIDVINMSYGEHAHWSNTGRVGDIICEVVNHYKVSWVVSGGNHGPALCTVGAPPDIVQPILIGVGAYVSPEMMSAAYSMRMKMCGGAFSWSSRGPTADGAAGLSVSGVHAVPRLTAPPDCLCVRLVALWLQSLAGVHAVPRLTAPPDCLCVRLVALWLQSLAGVHAVPRLTAPPDCLCVRLVALWLQSLAGVHAVPRLTAPPDCLCVRLVALWLQSLAGVHAVPRLTAPPDCLCVRLVALWLQSLAGVHAVPRLTAPPDCLCVRLVALWLQSLAGVHAVPRLTAPPDCLCVRLVALWLQSLAGVHAVPRLTAPPDCLCVRLVALWLQSLAGVHAVPRLTAPPDCLCVRLVALWLQSLAGVHAVPRLTAPPDCLCVRLVALWLQSLAGVHAVPRLTAPPDCLCVRLVALWLQSLAGVHAVPRLTAPPDCLCVRLVALWLQSLAGVHAVPRLTAPPDCLCVRLVALWLQSLAGVHAVPRLTAPPDCLCVRLVALWLQSLAGVHAVPRLTAPPDCLCVRLVALWLQSLAGVHAVPRLTAPPDCLCVRLVALWLQSLAGVHAVPRLTAPPDCLCVRLVALWLQSLAGVHAVPRLTAPPDCLCVRLVALWLQSLAGVHAVPRLTAPPDCLCVRLVALWLQSLGNMCGGAFSWSSRGPTADGAAGLSVCAPGGAVAAVARFTLRQSQLMNGTSMAAPHVAGAVAMLMSGLKAQDIPYSPYSMKRALENSATYLSHVEPWAQGCGLLNVEKAFEILSKYHDQPERDVTFSIQCGASNAKGILLRPQHDDAPKDIGVTVEPQFLQDHEDMENKSLIPKQIAFGVRLALSCDDAWLSAAKHLDMMNASRPITVRVDTTGLPPGPHFTSIKAYDVSCIEKGPVFRVPVTVLQPQPLRVAAPAPPAIQEKNVLFRPATIVRHFVIPPQDATWAVLKISTESKEKTGRFLIHTMQLLPKRSCRCHEMQKMINVTAEIPTVLPFQIVGGVTLEVVLAKYWANIGDVVVDYSVEFHGLKPDFGSRLVLGAADGLRPVRLRALRQQDVLPAATLKYLEPVLRPTESKLTPLTARDVIPPSRQIYQLLNTYNFHIAKATEVSPIISLLSDMLYESEFESQMWMLYNSNKQLLMTGDAYPSKYTTKLEKGDYTLRLNIRHENKSLLEKLQDLPAIIQQRLQQPITLDVYCSPSLAITGGKKFTSGPLPSGHILPVYFTPVPADKISRSNLSIGQTLSGSVTFAKDELGRKVDTYGVSYLPCEPAKRSQPNRDKDKPKPHDDYMDAVKDFTTNWLAKLEGDKLEQTYEELTEKFPGYVGAHVAYLHALDSPTDAKKLPHANEDPDVTTAWCEQLITISEKVIKAIDQDKLLAYLGLKNDTRSDANKIKQEQEKQRGYLIDALSRKGTALCRLRALAQGAAARDKLHDALKDNLTDLLKFTDLTDAKALHYGVWHCFTFKQWGRAIKLLQKIQEERPSKEVEERLIEAYGQLGWNFFAKYSQLSIPIKYPSSYRPF
uniref:Uncharacterized protein n=1 Tax=Heliothis virescens TaxID=7102 RepID=A0A2A4JXG6_HELVI